MTAPLEHLWLGTVEYRATWELQRNLALARREQRIPDCLLLLEHPPVYTMGRSGVPAHLGDGADALRARGADVVDVDRGGSVTFHGPGQLVIYPIIGLADRFPLAGEPGSGDVTHYIRALEEAMITTCAELGVEGAQQRPPYTGVWLPPERTDRGWEKLAAIGVKLAGGVTTHGIGLNLTTDLDWFRQVVPCGITDGGVCSILSITGGSPRAADAALVAAGAIALSFGATLQSAGANLRECVDGAHGVAVKAG